MNLYDAITPKRLQMTPRLTAWRFQDPKKSLNLVGSFYEKLLVFENFPQGRLVKCCNFAVSWECYACCRGLTTLNKFYRNLVLILTYCQLLNFSQAVSQILANRSTKLEKNSTKSRATVAFYQVVKTFRSNWRNSLTKLWDNWASLQWVSVSNIFFSVVTPRLNAWHYHSTTKSKNFTSFPCSEFPKDLKFL